MNYRLSGWWLQPSEKYESHLGWWHSQYMEKYKMFQTTNQLYRCIYQKPVSFKKNIMAEIGIELHSYFKLQEATPKHQAYIKQILTWWLGLYSFSWKAGVPNHHSPPQKKWSTMQCKAKHYPWGRRLAPSAPSGG